MCRLSHRKIIRELVMRMPLCKLCAGQAYPSTSVLVPMVRVGHMQMAMAKPLMSMGVSMRFAQRIVRRMLVLMVSIALSATSAG